MSKAFRGRKVTIARVNWGPYGYRANDRAYVHKHIITRGERHDNEDDHDSETGDRSPRCAQHVNPAVLLAQYGPYQSGPPLPHAPINRALPLRSPTFARVSRTSEVSSARAVRDTCGNVIKRRKPRTNDNDRDVRANIPSQK